MTEIAMNTAVKQELESRGVDETTGVYANHKVKLGKSSSVRIDAIKSASIPFAGFTKATKIARGKAGVEASADKVLQNLASSADKLSAKNLLGNLKAMQIHTDRLDKLGQLTDAQKADTSWTFATSVQKLSNTQLAAVFQTFASSEMDLLHTALIHEGRKNPNAADARAAAEQLFDLQALIIKEISNRSINEQITQNGAELEFEGLPEATDEAVSRPKTLTQQFGGVGTAANAVHANDITAANLEILAETASGSANIRERSVAKADQQLKARNIDNLTIKEIGNTIRSAELTINIQTQFLVGGGNTLMKHPNDPMVNIFHLHGQGIDPKGEGYLKLRDTTEKVLFPEFKGHNINADERPMYGSLNINGNRIGALKENHGYGKSAIVLKPEVAKRATYMVNDSFYSLPIDCGRERRDNFYKLLDGVNDSMSEFGEKIPQEIINALKDPQSKERKDLEAYFDQAEDESVTYFKHFPRSLDDLISNETKLRCQKNPNLDSRVVTESIHDAIKGLMTECFADAKQTRDKTATYDNVETLVTQMDSVNSNSLARAAIEVKNGQSLRAIPSNMQYIEAQIQGPIIPSRDIAEIRLYVDDIPADQQEATIREAKKFGKENGIKITLVDYEIAQEDDRTSDIEKANKEFISQHHDMKNIESIRDDYLDNVEARLKELIKFHNLEKDLPEGSLRLEGNALSAFVSSFISGIQSRIDAKYEDTDEDAVRVTFKNTATNALRHKAELLKTVYASDLNPAQKKAVSDWVVAAKALRTVDELKTVLKNAQAQSELFRNIIDAQPPLTAQQACAKIAEFSATMDKELSAMFTESYKGREVGPDDTMTEMNRISFMTIALMKNGEPPVSKESFEKLAGIIDGPEMKLLHNQLLGLEQNGDLIRNMNVETLNVVTSNLYIIGKNLRTEAGGVYTNPAPYRGNLNLLQKPVRTILAGINPALAEKLDKVYPAYAEFPKPASLEKMPASEAGRRKFLTNIMDSYITIEREYEKRTANHGRGHIARAYIYANVLSNILISKGIAVDKNAVMCGIAGHDVGRKGTGTDNWEQRSAEATVNQMKAAFGEDSMGQDYEQEVHDCIYKHKSKTIEGMLLNSADSLDYGRINAGAFRLEHFAFMPPEGSKPDPDIQEMRKELAREANLLQRLTSPFCAIHQQLDQFDQQMATATGEMETKISEVKESVLNSVAEQIRKDQDIPSDEYMKRFEDTIRNNPKMFPLLSKYYDGDQA
ncbi:MAG: DUF3626 domain-containing protein [Succinivibrionaceae bacterium]|nr:DUF3626 domain-containing protein [Succinivibrionaceae bacterium]